MPTLLVDLIYLLLALLILPTLLYKVIVLKKYRRGWGDRFGGVPRRDWKRPCVWIHGVSLGEINASRTLVEQLDQLRPDIDIVVSATTDTGFAAARRLYPDRIVFRYPLDISFVVRRALNRIRPNVIVLMELELWPNILRIASSRGIAVGVANGRITEEKSMRRFSQPIVRNVAHDMVRRLAWIAAQDGAYADRFRRLGAPSDRVIVAGSLKYTPPSSRIRSPAIRRSPKRWAFDATPRCSSPVQRDLARKRGCSTPSNDFARHARTCSWRLSRASRSDSMKWPG